MAKAFNTQVRSFVGSKGLAFAGGSLCTQPVLRGLELGGGLAVLEANPGLGIARSKHSQKRYLFAW